MEKTTEQVRDELVATFNASIVEIREAQLGHYVVATDDDGAALRQSATGHIAIFGAEIFTTNDRAWASNVAREFNRQLEEKGSSTRFVVQDSAPWRERRVNAIQGFISFVTAKA